MAKKILIIDDDPNIVKYLATLFKDNGYETVVARDGLEGFETVKKNKPDLITLDLEMPEEWGPRFYRKLSKEKELKDIPVIVISGLSGCQYSIPKAIATIKKPFDQEELIKLVKDTIGQ